MKEKKTRAPGGGRKPLPEADRLVQISVRLTHQQLERLKASGDVSKAIRQILEREEGR